MTEGIMTRTARVAADAERVSIAKSIAAAARGTALLVITTRALLDLERELGGPEQAARHLARLATNTGKPVAVNMPTGPATSRTLFISPKGWSRERLAGWIAGRHEDLENMFGDATPVPSEDLG
jgi:hypothetical protein